MSAALVLLAAGASSRLGTCKALCDLGPGTPLALLTEAGAPVSADPPLVVTGAHHDAIAAAAPPGVELLHNPAWAAGRTGGLRLARGRRPGRDLVVAPVDVPLVPGAVFAALAAAWERAGSPPGGWLAPSWAAGDGPARHGHPVWIGAELAGELDRMAPDAPLRRLRARADPLLAVPVATDAILDDLDSPRDLERLRRKIAGA